MEQRKPGHEDLPKDEERSERRQEEAQEKLDEIPPHGTDPLHEGP